MFRRNSQFELDGHIGEVLEVHNLGKVDSVRIVEGLRRIPVAWPVFEMVTVISPVGSVSLEHHAILIELEIVAAERVGV